MASAASDLDPAAAEPQVVDDEQVVEVVVEPEPAKGEGAEEEEEGECGFCLYMKGGGCKEAFEAWEDCVAAAEKDGSDMVERCFQTTANLKTCMEAHSEYYAPVFQAEQAVNEAAAIAHAEKNKGEESAPSPATDDTKKEESVPEPAVASADEKEEAVPEPAAAPADEKEESVPEPAAAAADEKEVVVVEKASSSPAFEETKEEQAVAEKV